MDLPSSTCRIFRATLAEGRIDPAVVAHPEACPACRSWAACFERLPGALRALPQPTLPPGFSGRLRARLRAPVAPTPARSRAPAWVLGGALLAAATGVLFLARPTAVRQDASFRLQLAFPTLVGADPVTVRLELPPCVERVGAAPEALEWQLSAADAAAGQSIDLRVNCPADGLVRVAAAQGEARGHGAVRLVASAEDLTPPAGPTSTQEHDMHSARILTLATLLTLPPAVNAGDGDIPLTPPSDAPAPTQPSGAPTIPSAEPCSGDGCEHGAMGGTMSGDCTGDGCEHDGMGGSMSGGMMGGMSAEQMPDCGMDGAPMHADGGMAGSHGAMGDMEGGMMGEGSMHEGSGNCGMGGMGQGGSMEGCGGQEGCGMMEGGGDMGGGDMGGGDMGGGDMGGGDMGGGDMGGGGGCTHGD